MSDFGRLGWCSCAAFIVLSFLWSWRLFFPPISLLALGFIGLSAVAALGRLSSMKRLTPAEKYLFAGIGFICIAAFFGACMYNRAHPDPLTERLEREAAEFPSGRRHHRQYYPKPNYDHRRNQR